MTLSLNNSHGTNQRNERIIKAKTFRSGSEQILQLISVLQIPELPSSSAFITVQVKGPTLQFINRKSVQITQAESLVFVQTDKPTYKPGQTGIRNQRSKGNNFKGPRCGSLLIILQSWKSCMLLSVLLP